MISRSLLVVVAVLLFTSPAFSQFASGNRLNDLASRLSRDAEDFAASSYSNLSNNSRASRNDIEQVMLANQFAGASRIFYRMTVDRRRSQTLRDAFDILQNLARSVERNNVELIHSRRCKSIVESDFYCSVTTPLSVSCFGVVAENASHHGGGQGKELSPVFPLHALLVHQTHVSLINECSCFQSVTFAFAA